MNEPVLSRATTAGPRIEHVVRTAGVNDAALLAHMCYVCFPTTWPWNTPQWYRRHWWANALRSACAEAFICELAGQPAGFAILVTNETGWNSERAYRSDSILWRLLAATLRPQCGLRLIGARCSMLVRRTNQSSQYAPLSQPPETRAYADTLGVMPTSRRQGLARLLMEHRESRSRALGKTLIWAIVDSGNFASEKLLEHCQYRCIGRRVEKYTFTSVWEKQLT